MPLFALVFPFSMQAMSQAEFASWQQDLQRQIAACDSQIVYWTDALASAEHNLQNAERSNYPDPGAIRDFKAYIQNDQQEIQANKNKKAQLEAQLRNPPSIDPDPTSATSNSPQSQASTNLYAQQQQAAQQRQALLQQQYEAKRQQVLNARQALAQQQATREEYAANQRQQLVQGVVGIFAQHAAASSETEDSNDEAAMQQARQQMEAEHAQLEAANRAVEAQRAAEAVRIQDQQDQALLAERKQAFAGLLPSADSDASRASSSSWSSLLADTGAATMTRNVANQTATTLATEMFNQVTSGESPDLSKAAQSGTLSVIKDAAKNSGKALYDAALDLLPPDRATDVRAYQIPLSYLTFNYNEIKSAYNDLIQKEIRARWDSITVDSVSSSSH